METPINSLCSLCGNVFNRASDENWHRHGLCRREKRSVNGISNIWPYIARFGFDQIPRDPGLDLPSWANRFEVEYSNIWCDCPIWHRYLQNSEWPIISLIFSHKLTYSHSDWSVQTQMQPLSTSPLLPSWAIAMRLEDWTGDFNMSFFLDGIVKDVGNCGCGW